jgi:hypothetical protein
MINACHGFSCAKAALANPFTFKAELPQTQTLPQTQDLTLRYWMLHWDSDSRQSLWKQTSSASGLPRPPRWRAYSP